MFERICKKDTTIGSCEKFVQACSCGVGKIETSKDAHVIIGGVLAKKVKERNLGRHSGGQSPIENVGGGVERLYPKWSRVVGWLEWGERGVYCWLYE